MQSGSNLLRLRRSGRRASRSRFATESTRPSPGGERSARSVSGPRTLLSVASLVVAEDAAAAIVGVRDPVILLHGFGTTSRVLLPLERGLQRRLDRPVVRVRLGGRLPIHAGDIRGTARRLYEAIGCCARVKGFEYADLIGHSMGGLVAAYVLKRLDAYGLVRRVVTLGTPHRGTPAALAGVVLLGGLCRSAWQMLPGSSLVRELDRSEVPEGSRLVSIVGGKDWLVPHPFAEPASGARTTCHRDAQADHWDLLTSERVFGLVHASLVDRTSEPEERLAA